MCRLSRLAIIVAVVSIAVPQGNALAGFFGVFKKVVRTVTFPLTAPTETIINTGRVVAGQAGPGAIISPYRQVARSSGQLLQGTTRLAAFPYQELNRRAQYLANLAGEPGAFVFDVTTFTQRFFNELAVSTGMYSGTLLQQSNPLQVIAIPLASAIRAARERHIRNARPIPYSVRAALAPYFPPAVIARAKYAIGRTDITLPNFIDQVYRFQGDDFAVTIDDIIVFNTDPGDFQDNPLWWTHEMTHVQQYWRWGVERFAYEYMIDHSAVEAEADNNAGNIVYGRIPADGGFGSTLLARASQQGGSWPALPDRSYVQYDSSRRLVSDYYAAQLVLFGYSEPVNYLITQKGVVMAVDVRSGGSYQVGWAVPRRIQAAAWSIEAGQIGLDVLPDGRVMQQQPRLGYVVVGQILNL